MSFSTVHSGDKILMKVSIAALIPSYLALELVETDRSPLEERSVT